MRLSAAAPSDFRHPRQVDLQDLRLVPRDAQNVVVRHAQAAVELVPATRLLGRRARLTRHLLDQRTIGIALVSLSLWPSPTRRPAVPRSVVASMRPRRIRRGNEVVCDDRNNPSYASMRPRRIPRGNTDPRAVRAEAGQASMMPGRIRRGNCTAALAACLAVAAFNEAPANSPGKSLTTAADVPVPADFNEAPANSPGKYVAAPFNGLLHGQLQ